MKPSELHRLYPESIKNPALRSYLTILCQKGVSAGERAARLRTVVDATDARKKRGH